MNESDAPDQLKSGAHSRSTLPAVSVAFLRMQLHHSAGAETAQVVQRVELHTTKTFWSNLILECRAEIDLTDRQAAPTTPPHHARTITPPHPHNHGRRAQRGAAALVAKVP